MNPLNGSSTRSVNIDRHFGHKEVVDMTLRVWDPTFGTTGIADPMHRLFDNAWVRPGSMFESATYSMPLDIEDTGEGFIVKANLPGFHPADVNVTVTGDTLTIVAERKQEEGNKNYLLHERWMGRVSRTVMLPASVQADQVQARYENGELTLTLPKSESLRPRQIQIWSEEKNALTGGKPEAQVIDHKPAQTQEH